MANTNVYQNGKIYKLYVDDETNPYFYYGSTTQKYIKERRTQHKQRSKLCPDNQMYKILNNVGWDKVKISLIEKFPCGSKFELNDRENKYIKDEFLNPFLLNKQHAVLKLDNIYETNKYKTKNKNKVENTTKTKYLIQQEEYRNKNKKHKCEYDKEYVKRNLEYISECRKIKITCDCGTTLTKSHLQRHINESKKHKRYLDSINNSFTPFSKCDQERNAA